MINNFEKNALYVVATPIGNLGDITLRALDILKKADIIFAEDTRTTTSLLNKLGIKKHQTLIASHDHNEERNIQKVINFIKDDKLVALVSDAGTPLISDPGYKIVSKLTQENIKVVPITGASAIITALCASGLPSDSFFFKGFLAHKSSKRQVQLKQLTNTKSTIILYESVHRIKYILREIGAIMPNNKIVVAKELTKKFENFFHGSAMDILDILDNDRSLVKGEFVVLIDNNNVNIDIKTSKFDSYKILKDLLEYMPIKKAITIIMKISNENKNTLYEKALEIKNN